MERTIEQKTVKGINFFDPVDNALLHALQNPQVNIAGIRRADLLPLLDRLSPDRLSRQLRRLRDLGVIKRVTGTYRYYLTRIGRRYHDFFEALCPRCSLESYWTASLPETSKGAVRPRR
jgi:DNA-binding HxlR family transcriptional regulator